jgi:4-amino-4-deoxy-L-arabinose transferase-like glycosyltransferase
MAYTAKSEIPKVKKHLLKVSSQIDPWLVAVLACFTLFAWASWGIIGGNPMTDIGREVEIPARLVDGQLLYRDAATYYGPLAYYANALALLVFGHHLEVFYTVGLVLALAATLLFYHLAKRLTNARWAALCTLCMLIYCAFGIIFNFILPYSYGAVYATVLCLLAVTTLDYYTCTGRTRWLVAAAIACGLAGLGKQEYGVAVLGGILVGANLYYPQSLRTRVERSVLVFVVAGVSAFLPLALLAQQVSWENIYLSLFPVNKFSVLTQNTLLQNSPATTIFSWYGSFKVFFFSSLLILVSVIAAHWLVKLKWFNSNKWLKRLVELIASLAFSLFGLTCLNQSGLFKHYSPMTVFHPLGDLSWSLPLFVGWFTVTRPRLPQDKYAPILWALLAFSLLLNARWGFRIYAYGLYAPSVILLFFTLLYQIAQRTGKVIGHYLLICLLIAGSLQLQELSHYRYEVNSSYGTFYTKYPSFAHAFQQTISAINASGASSVLVVSDGKLLNFLTATHSPSRELFFLPSVLSTPKEEEEFLKRMQANPPELIVDVPSSFQQWGYKTYAEFNPLVDRWITQQHRLVHTFPVNESMDEGAILIDEGAIRVYARD